MTEKIVEKLDFKSNPSNYYILNLQPNKQSVQTIYELSIPTCSYRMGVPNMGYGVMTLSIIYLKCFYLDIKKTYYLYKYKKLHTAKHTFQYYGHHRGFKQYTII